MLGIGALQSASVDVVAATDSDVHLGRGPFVELFLEHDGLASARDDGLLGVEVGCGEPKYFTHDSGVYVAHGSPSSFEGESIVSTGMKQRFFPTTVFEGETDSVPVSVSDPHYLTEHLRVVEEYTYPQISLDTTGESAVDVRVEDEQLSVPANRELEVVLDPRTVDVRYRGEYERIANEREEGPETVAVRRDHTVGTLEVTPRVRVVNHGVVDRYGIENGVVLPADPSIPMAKRILENERYRTDSTVERRGTDLIVVRTEGSR